jgi:hypothetical protein
MNAEWSDSKKWKMDLVKSAITFSVAALISLFLIDFVQEQRIQKKARADAEYSARLKALDEFRSTSVHYDAAAHAAFADLFEWKVRLKTPAMVRYEQDAYPKWKASIETTSHMFPEHSADIRSLEKAALARHDIYNTLVDQRLDSREPLKEVNPWPVRGDFHSLSKQSAEARTLVIRALQSAVFSQDAQ